MKESRGTGVAVCPIVQKSYGDCDSGEAEHVDLDVMGKRVVWTP